MLKLIFSDLDDTLLDSKKTVSDETINFIKGLKDTRFIVNSGRLPYNMESIKQYIDLSNMVCKYSNCWFLECHHKDASKGNAIDIVSKLLNIKPEEVLAIGDNENDLSMFNRGYHSACPSNANEKVKSAVEYVSPFDCNNDAMIDIIKKFL